MNVSNSQGVGLPLPPNPISAALSADGAKVAVSTGPTSSADVGDVGSIHSGGGIFQVPDGFFQRPGEDSPQYINGQGFFGTSPIPWWMIAGGILVMGAFIFAIRK